MLVSLNWLKEYVNIDNINPKDLAEKITRSGIEVESVEILSDATNVVVGYVVSKEPHPDASKLNVCQVDVGGEIQQIVCGASNVDKDQKVIVAKVGASLPGDFKIKEAKLRGVDSNGMICSYQELGIENKYIDDELKDGIAVLASDAPVGHDALDYLKLDDTILELGLTPNRSDCLSMLGVAYEVAAILDEEIILPNIELSETSEDINEYLSLEVNTELVPMYTARIVKDITVKESPQFIKSRLIAAGIRPISNVVDITNYVMLEYGQPLHAFDYDKLGNKIVVRMATNDEEVITLDDETRKLKDSHIAITNGKDVVAVAGVMGAANTEVSNQTKTVVLESAYFDALTVRYASKDLGLRSESSARFEKGLDPNRVVAAIDRAAELLHKYADGKVVNGIVKHDVLEKDEKTVSITQTKINSVLGMDIPLDKITTIFKQLGFDIILDDKTFTVNVPTRRQDILIEEDLIEEVGRLYGFDNLESKLPVGNTLVGGYDEDYLKRKKIRHLLQGLGLNQVITYTLTNDTKLNQFTEDTFESIKLSMPMSEERSTLRYSLIPSLLEVVNHNLARNNNDVFIYEIGSSYFKDDEYKDELKITAALCGQYVNNKWLGEYKNVDFYVTKGIVETLFNYLGLNGRYSFKKATNKKDFHPGRTAEIVIGRDVVGVIGQVHPQISKNEVYVFELSLDKVFEQKVRAIKFKEVPKFPGTNRDVAFIVSKEVSAGDIISVIKKAGGRSLINVNIFDVYQGEHVEEGMKSIAFNLEYQHQDRTLTDAEVTESFENVIKNVEKKFNAKLRG